MKITQAKVAPASLTSILHAPRAIISPIHISTVHQTNGVKPTSCNSTKSERHQAISEFKAQNGADIKKLVDFLEYRNSWKGRFWSILNNLSSGKIKIPNSDLQDLNLRNLKFPYHLPESWQDLSGVNLNGARKLVLPHSVNLRRADLSNIKDLQISSATANVNPEISFTGCNLQNTSVRFRFDSSLKADFSKANLKNAQIDLSQIKATLYSVKAKVILQMKKSEIEEMELILGDWVKDQSTQFHFE